MSTPTFNDRAPADSQCCEIEDGREKRITMDVNLRPELLRVRVQPWIRIRAVKADGEIYLAAAVRALPEDDDGA